MRFPLRYLILILFILFVGDRSTSGLTLDSQPGFLDPSFGLTGIVTTPLPPTNTSDFLQDIQIQSDGKIVGVGIQNSNSTGPKTFIARYNQDGSLDQTFASGGYSIFRVGLGSVNSTHDLQILPDGKILISGTAISVNGGDFFLMRFDASGTIDPTFGDAGTVFTDFYQGLDYAFALEIQPDGKIVIGGEAKMPVGYDFALARYHPDGSLDQDFGNGGKVTTTGTLGFDDIIRSIAFQPDGKIVAAGSYFNGTGRDIAILRYNTNGTPDVTFSGDGLFVFSTGGDESIESLHVQADGKIVGIGYASTIQQDDFLIVRSNPNGTFDTSFSGDGIQISPISDGYNDRAYDGVLLPNGKILAVGTAESGPYKFTLVCYNSDGTYDSGFGAAGVVQTSINRIEDVASATAIDTQGRIVAAGSSFDGLSERDLALVRYEPNGTLDESFGILTGTVTTSFSAYAKNTARDVTVQADGNILVAGTSQNQAGNLDLSLTRYTPAEGRLDLNFANGGRFYQSLSTGDDGANALAVQSDGKILVGGFSGTGSNSNFAVLRLNPTGVVDTSFNFTGRVFIPIGSGEDVANSISIQGDGKILIAGSATSNSDTDAAVVRLTPDGVLDSTFDGDGKMTFSFDAGSDVLRSIAVTENGKIVVTGFSERTTGNRNAAVARLNSDGSLDPTFGVNGKSVYDLGGLNDEFRATSVLSDGRFVATGTAGTTTGAVLLVCRLNHDGSFDSTFDLDGCSVRSIGSGASDVGNDVAVQSNGKIVVAGTTRNSVVTGDITRTIVLRLNANGAPDLTFGINGVTTTSRFRNAEANAVAFEQDGDIIVAGSIDGPDRGNFLISRYFGGPFAATANVNGRVLTAGGLGIRNSVVNLIDSNGNRRQSTTSSFGNYVFANVPTGDRYTLTVNSKRYRFAPQTFVLSEEINGRNLIGLE